MERAASSGGHFEIPSDGRLYPGRLYPGHINTDQIQPSNFYTMVTIVRTADMCLKHLYFGNTDFGPNESKEKCSFM